MNDDMRKLREFRGEVPEMPGGVLREAERSFVTTLRAEQTTSRPRQPSRFRRPLLAVTGLATAAAGVAVAVVLTSTPATSPPVAGRPAGAPASAAPPVKLQPVSVAEVLDLAAAAGAGVTPAPGQFVVTESVVQDVAYLGEDDRYLYRMKHTVWSSSDNSKPGAIRSEQLAPLAFPGRPIPAGVPSAGQVDLYLACPSTGDAPRRDYAYYGTLPADAQSMLGQFRKYPGGGADKNYYLWKAGYELAGAAMPGAQHAAVFQALKLVPGAQLIGDAQDAAGRTGTAVGYVDTAGGVRIDLIFDPGTFAYLGSRSVVVDAAKAGAPAGTELAAAAQVSVSVADTAPAAQPGPKQAPCA